MIGCPSRGINFCGFSNERISILSPGTYGGERLPLHFGYCVFRLYSNTWALSPLGVREQIVLCANGYDFVCKLFNREYVCPVKIGERAFSPKNPESRTPEVWFVPTGVTVACSPVRCRAPPVLKSTVAPCMPCSSRGREPSMDRRFNRACSSR